MQFPIAITFKLAGWYAHVHLTDGHGNMLGYLPPPRKGLLQLPVYADERMGSPIYTIKAEHMFTHWFEDAAGRRIGEYGITASGGMGGGKFVQVGGEPRFHLVYESELVDFIDRLVPSLPLLNGLTGLFVRPTTLAVRKEGGGTVLRIEKRRRAIDVRYTIQAIEEIGGSECECLILSALLHALMDHSFRFMR